MTRNRHFAWIVLGTAMLAGCLDDRGAAPLATTHDDRPGTLWGFVLDDQERPLSGANITAAEQGLVASSSADGTFRLENIPTGILVVRASHPGHEPQDANVSIVGGQETRHDFRLPQRPMPIHRNETLTFRGSYDCAHEALILGGDCFVLYENVTGQPDPVTNEAYAFRLPVGADWKTIDVELRWKQAANDQLDGMRLLVEHGNASKTGHGIQVARADGSQNPLRVHIERGQPHPSADRYEGSMTQAQVPDEGEALQVRIHPRGRFADEAGSACPPAPCFIGIGFGLGVSFDVTTVVYYPPTH